MGTVFFAAIDAEPAFHPRPALVLCLPESPFLGTQPWGWEDGLRFSKTCLPLLQPPHPCALHGERDQGTLQEVMVLQREILATRPSPSARRFTTMLSTSATREKFISSAISLLRTHHFDGLDLCFLYPGLRGSPTHDRWNFLFLIQVRPGWQLPNLETILL